LLTALVKLEHAITHKSAKTHTGSVFVTRDLDLRPFDPKIKGFGFQDSSWNISNVKFGDPTVAF